MKNPIWTILLLSAIAVHGQSTSPAPVAPPSDLPGNWIGAGASVQTSGKVLQSATSWVAGAAAVNAKLGIYTYDVYDNPIIKGQLAPTVQTGGAVFLRRFGILDTFTFGTVGVSQTAAGAALAASTGVIGILRLKGGFDLIITRQFSKGTGAVARVGFGWTL